MIRCASPLRGLHTGAERQLGYYALPLLWRDAVVGWATVDAHDVRCGYVAGSAPREAAFRRELEAEIAALRVFLQPR